MPFDATPVTNPVIEALREGRSRIERGWCQHDLGNRDGGPVCVVGALYFSTGTDSGDYSRAVPFLERIIGPHISRWNDSPDRTQADVIALYDQAIELAVAEELERVNAAV